MSGFADIRDVNHHGYLPAAAQPRGTVGQTFGRLCTINAGKRVGELWGLNSWTQRTQPSSQTLSATTMRCTLVTSGRLRSLAPPPSEGRGVLRAARAHPGDEVVVLRSGSSRVGPRDRLRARAGRVGARSPVPSAGHDDDDRPLRSAIEWHRSLVVGGRNAQRLRRSTQRRQPKKRAGSDSASGPTTCTRIPSRLVNSGSPVWITMMRQGRYAEAKLRSDRDSRAARAPDLTSTPTEHSMQGRFHQQTLPGAGLKCNQATLLQAGRVIRALRTALGKTRQDTPTTCTRSD